MLGRFRSLRLLLLLALLPCWRAHATQPDLFLDGEALANALTEKLLSDPEYDSMPERKKVFFREPNMNGFRKTLMQGAEFEAGHDLTQWLLTQPDDSVSLDNFLMEAVKKNRGSVRLGLIAAWNTLRADYTDVEGRNLFPHIRKLKDVTGERDIFDGQVHERTITPKGGKAKNQRIRTLRGDNFSAWYHFVGTALSSFHLSSSSKVSRLGKLETDLMIAAEEHLIGKVDGFSVMIDPLKRIEIDKAGSLFGLKLSKNLTKFESAAAFRASKEARNTRYLYDAPKVYGPRWALLPGQHPRDFGTQNKTLDRLPLWRRLMEATLASKQNPPDLAALKQHYSDGNDTVAGTALEAIDKLAPEQRVHLLQSLVEDTSNERASIRALEQLTESSSTPPDGAWLESLFLRNPSRKIKLALLRAVENEEVSGKDHLGPVKAALRDPDFRIRAAAVRALRPYPHDVEAIQLLATARRDVSAIVSEAVPTLYPDLPG
jgi:hypothetical protein